MMHHHVSIYTQTRFRHLRPCLKRRGDIPEREGERRFTIKCGADSGSLGIVLVMAAVLRDVHYVFALSVRFSCLQQVKEGGRGQM